MIEEVKDFFVVRGKEVCVCDEYVEDRVEPCFCPFEIPLKGLGIKRDFGDFRGFGHEEESVDVGVF